MEIKPYQPGQEKEILDLFNLCFGKSISQEYWSWRFKNNPFTDKIFIDLMWDKKKLVGHYAISPIELLIEDEKIFSGLSMTTMTHPEYAGKGIFTNLAKSLYQKLKEEEYNFVWGFPNNNSHYGFLKNLNWKNIAIQNSMSLDSNDLRKITTNTNIIETDKFDNISNLFNERKKVIRINKTAEYLTWRYLTNPSSLYHTLINQEQNVGIIYKKIKSFKDKKKYEIDIMELFHNDDINSIILVLNHILKKEEGVIQFNIWDSLFSTNQLILEKIGFKLNSHSTYFGFCELIKTKYIDDYKNWDISYGYSDVF